MADPTNLSDTLNACANADLGYSPLSWDDAETLGQRVSVVGNWLSTVSAGLLAPTLGTAVLYPPALIGLAVEAAGALAGVGVTAAGVVMDYNNINAQQTDLIHQLGRAGMDPCILQQHYLSLYPDGSVPQEATEFRDAFRDPEFRAAVRNHVAADAGQALREQGGAAAEQTQNMLDVLDKFEALEEERLLADRQTSSSVSPAQAIPSSSI